MPLSFVRLPCHGTGFQNHCDFFEESHHLFLAIFLALSKGVSPFLATAWTLASACSPAIGPMVEVHLCRHSAGSSLRSLNSEGHSHHRLLKTARCKTSSLSPPSPVFLLPALLSVLLATSTSLSQLRHWCRRNYSTSALISVALIQK
jgi:hypothetical protein